MSCLTANIDAALGENFREFWLPVIDDSTPTVGDIVIGHAFLCEGDELSGEVIGLLTNILTTINVIEDGVGQTFAVLWNFSFNSNNLKGGILLSGIFSTPITITDGLVFVVCITNGSGDLAGDNGFYEHIPDSANGIGIIDLKCCV
eukprot:8733978-Ditylum_brightwellii.AAC.1